MNFVSGVKDCWYLIRAQEWWHYKFPVALGVIYSLAWSQGITSDKLILPTLLILMAGSALAIFASVFNDFIDMDQDRQAGKTTRLMKLSRGKRRLVVSLSFLLNAYVAYLLSNLTGAFVIFMSIWALYTAYSLPPVRLKERGALGVLTIALGEHLLASLLAIYILVGLVNVQVPAFWLGAVLVWALCFGCRGIIWHQLDDLENDLKSQCSTFCVNIGFDRLKFLAERVLFPIEIIAYSVILLSNFNGLSIILLSIYGITEYLRNRFSQANVIIASPAPNARFVMFEYYQLYFPLSFLFAGLAYDAGFVNLIALFCVLFSAPLAQNLLCWNSVRPRREAKPTKSRKELKMDKLKEKLKAETEKMELETK